MRAFKLWNGTHIDLDHILEIGPVFSDDFPQIYVGFNIQYMFRDKPVFHGVPVRFPPDWTKDRSEEILDREKKRLTEEVEIHRQELVKAKFLIKMGWPDD